jgi:hypothetical protein
VSKDHGHVTIRLRVFGNIGNSTMMLPILLPGVAVTLSEYTPDQRPRAQPRRGTVADPQDDRPEHEVLCEETDATGTARFRITPATYTVSVKIGNLSDLPGGSITVTPEVAEYCASVTLTGWNLTWSSDPQSDGTAVVPGSVLPYGKNVFLTISWPGAAGNLISTIVGNRVDLPPLAQPPDGRQRHLLFTGSPGPIAFQIGVGGRHARFLADDTPTTSVPVLNPEPVSVEGSISVSNRRTSSRMTEDVPLWVSIRKGTDALSFDHYFDFMNWVFCNDGDLETPPAQMRKPGLLGQTAARRFLPFTDTDAYRNIKVATEAFVMANCGVFTGFSDIDADYIQNQVVIPTSPAALDAGLKTYLESVQAPGVTELLPYLAIIRRKLIDQQIKDKDIGDIVLGANVQNTNSCYGLLRRKLACPCLLELIWSYWQEEGMLVQTMNALARRFQNIRSPIGNDPLANLEIDPLRPLNNVIWGYIQDEQHRLSVVRRNYEYDHHYGLRLAGRAVREARTADSRSKFLEAFHTLLSITAAFYKRDDDTTIVADGFPVLNGLKEAHLILSQGAHNQFGDLPSTARIEMLMEQWVLSRPEFREFLPTRIMVAYPEPWMDRVDAMKKLQGWTDTSVLHFRNLAVFGEQVLLSIRYGAWADVNDPLQGTNWARYWRPEIQGYMHAYRSVTGIDLTVDVTNARIDAIMPSVHLVQRLVEQQRRA